MSARAASSLGDRAPMAPKPRAARIFAGSRSSIRKRPAQACRRSAKWMPTAPSPIWPMRAPFVMSGLFEA